MPTADAPLLDLRNRRLGEPLPPPLLVTRSTVTGTAHGWTVEGQRRQVSTPSARYPGQNDPHRMICLRLTHPDGRILNLLDHHGDMGVAKGAVSRVLGKPAAMIVHNGASAQSLLGAADALARLFDVAWTLATNPLRDDLTGDDLSRMLLCASYDLPYGPITQVLREAQSLSTALGRLSVPVLGALVEANMSVTEALGWFDSDFERTATPAKVKEINKFRAAGWNRDHLWAMKRHAGDDVPVTWSRLSPEDALIAARAGLSAREAARLRRRGPFDEDMLNTLIALRTGSTDNLGLLSA